MIRKTVLIALLILSSSSTLPAQATGVDSPIPITLSSMRDRYRPLLIFSPANTPLFRHQLRLAAAQMFELHQRDVILVPLLLRPDNKPWSVALGPFDLGAMSPGEAATARKHFNVDPQSFTVILLGKDGEEKLRSNAPISYERLRALIDSMPMRQQEMREKNLQPTEPLPSAKRNP